MLTETNNGGLDALTYQYDATGNILSRQLGANTLGYTYDPDHKHAVKTVTINGQVKTFVYDANGNMTTGFDFTDPANIASRTITYNTENLPTQIKYTKGGSTATTTFGYDGDGVRTKKIVQGGTTTYYIGEHYEVAGGVPTLYIFAGNQRIAKITGSDKHYFHQDHLGSSTTISDASGAGVETAEYMPFGAMREHSGSTVSNYKYTGQELDPETGLYNYKARLYDPVLGRFITADSIVPGFSDPQAFNRYAYCLNNPIIYADPSGHHTGGYEGPGHGDGGLDMMADGSLTGPNAPDESDNDSDESYSNNRVYIGEITDARRVPWDEFETEDENVGNDSDNGDDRWGFSAGTVATWGTTRIAPAVMTGVGAVGVGVGVVVGTVSGVLVPTEISQEPDINDPMFLEKYKKPDNPNVCTMSKPNRKKQGRELDEQKRKDSSWFDNSNKRNGREQKNHTPSKKHKGGK